MQKVLDFLKAVRAAACTSRLRLRSVVQTVCSLLIADTTVLLKELHKQKFTEWLSVCDHLSVIIHFYAADFVALHASYNQVAQMLKIPRSNPKES